jgi:uncharacterized cofD-like protein
MKNIVVIGGGTGSYTVLRGIKNISNISITSIVTSADSGGSTGVLRDEFGTLPVGDFRQALVALSSEDGDSNILRELFQYRFSKGGVGLEGHNFGNLFLTALTDIVGSEEVAFRKASKILNIKGRVLPITLDPVQLVAKYENGAIGFGEHMIDEPPIDHDGKLRIKKLWAQPKGTIMEKSKQAIMNADLIIMGPGDLYTSTLAAVVVDNVARYIKKTNAKIAYIVNLVTKYGQTHDFGALDHVLEVEKYIKRPLNFILVNSTKIPGKTMQAYRAEQAYRVLDDLGSDGRVVREDLISDILVGKVAGDKVKRSLVRHDSEKLRRVIENIINNL